MTAKEARRAGVRCDGTLPVLKEPCARYAGHRDEHRSAYVMANARLMRWGRGLRQLVAA